MLRSRSAARTAPVPSLLLAASFALLVVISSAGCRSMWDKVRENERTFALENARTNAKRGRCAAALGDLDRAEAIMAIDRFAIESLQIRLRCYDKLGLTELRAAHRRLLDDYYQDEPMAFPAADGSSVFRIKSGAPARFDPEELKRVNAAVLHQTEYAAVKSRLAAYGADKGEAFWNAVRANLTLLPDVKDWARIVDGPIEPVVPDAAFAGAAADVLPSGAYDASTWQAFTNAVKEKTGAKGKALFMPLRQALTGREHGPEMAALFPLIGEERARKRLSGQTA